MSQPCKTKWLMLDNKILEEYEAPKYSKCKKCGRFKFTFFVHQKVGDYYCYICSESGNIRALCFNCSNSKINM